MQLTTLLGVIAASTAVVVSAAPAEPISYPLCGATPDFPYCDEQTRQNPLFTVKPWMDAFYRMVANQGVAIPNIPPAKDLTNLSAGTTPWKNLKWGDPANPSTELCACMDGAWAFTFDDGPKSKTRDVLALLKKNNVKGTFFVIGANIVMTSRFRDNLKAIDADGHQIALHAWAHPPMTTRTTEALVSEIVYTALAVYRAIGKVPRYFRQPYGDIDDRVRFILASMGLRSTLWNFDTNDWQADANDNLATVTDKLKGTLQNGYMTPLTWVPDRNGAGSSNKVYKGFISLHHELNDIEYKMSELTINTVLSSTSLAGVPNKFKPSLVHECDYVSPNTPYMTEADPFYNMIVYWDKQLPLRDADLTASSGFPIDFGRPVATTQRPRPANLPQPVDPGDNGGSSGGDSGSKSLPGGISLWGWIGIGIAGFIVFTGIVVRVVSHVYRRSGGFVPKFFKDPASTAAEGASQRPSKHGPMERGRV
ncbi:chitin deacetylase [Phlyctochytrium planicorne]|nr:chitin deacetylase [Phlyctochytrium planicorne]